MFFTFSHIAPYCYLNPAFQRNKDSYYKIIKFLIFSYHLSQDIFNKLSPSVLYRNNHFSPFFIRVFNFTLLNNYAPLLIQQPFPEFSIIILRYYHIDS